MRVENISYVSYSVKIYMIYDMGWGGRVISKIFLTMIAKSTFQSSKLLVILAYRKSRTIEINVNGKVNI